MNKRQWNVLGMGFWIIAFLFMGVDFVAPSVCDSMNIDGSLSEFDVFCIVRMESYDPFISFSFLIGIVFFMCGYFEDKK